MFHEHAPTLPLPENGLRTGPTAQRRAVATRYRSIVVPTILDPSDRSALLHAMELAALHGAVLSVLYLRPGEEPANSYNWLDAIDRLHRSFNQSAAGAPIGDHAGDGDRIRSHIKQFLRRQLPASLVESVEIHADWRSGEPGDAIVRFAEAAVADLIVLSSGTPRWWLPSLPRAVRHVLQRSKREVLVVRPDALPAPAGASR